MKRRRKLTGKTGTKLLSCITAAFVTVAMIGAGIAPVYAASCETVKEETVYVVTDNSGAAKDIIVSDHLLNGDKRDKITDSSNLTDIENVKGNETFSKGKKGALIWDAGGGDIYYQGKTNKALPVTMDISYYFNGRKISGKELQGKSGSVKVKIKYENKQTARAEGKTVSVPFAVMTGFLVQDNCFKNIKVSSGKVIDDGEKQIVACMAVPGLCDSLGISPEATGLSDTVEITGTADKFNIEDMMTIVTGSIFEDIDSDKLDSLNMDGQIKALDDGAKALVSGSEELYDGMALLSSKSSELTKGVKQLNNGAQALKSGTASALSGSRDLASGSMMFSGILGSKLSLLRDGAEELYTGSSKINSGIVSIAAGFNGDRTSSNPGLVNGAASVASGIGNIQAALNGDGTSSNPGLVKGAAGVKSGIIELRNEISGLESDMTSAVNDSVTQLESAKGILSELMKDENATEDQKQKYQQAIDKINASETVQADLSGAVSTDKILQLEQGAAGVSEGINEIAAGVNGTPSNTGLATGALGISKGIKSIAIGLNGDGTSANPGLVRGASELRAGAEALAGGLGAATAKGTKDNPSLTSSAEDIAKGASALAEGEKSLSSGASELAKGMSQLNASSGKLVGGIDELNTGSLKLKKGMNKFYHEGIEKLVELYNGQLKGVTGNIGAVIKAGQQYDSFTKLHDGMSGSVKFIYKTEMTK